MEARMGRTASWHSGMGITSSARPGGNSAPSVTMAMIGPLRALISCIEDTTLLNISPLMAKNTDGHFSLTRAMGPCFISAAG
jgi:hypothetical protein